MVGKEIDFKSLNNRYEKSGFEAEKQMSFYLKRAFSERDDLYVINDLRLHVDKEYAQIDHLVLHKYGFIIIESKSVTDTIAINEYGEWKRIYHNQESGMPSPIQQVKRQIDILKKFLITKKSKGIDKFPYDTLVAISDNGIIKRDNIELNEICKADSIPEQIENIVQGYTKESKKFLSFKKIHTFSKENINTLAKFLVESHIPKEKKANAKAKAKKETPKTPIKPKKILSPKKASLAQKCTKCQSSDISIEYGRYGYYFKCKKCQSNRKIDLKCNYSSCKPKLKKEKEKFYKTCQDCNIKELFFVNKPKS